MLCMYSVGLSTETENKEKHSVWDLMPEMTVTSPYVHSRVDSNTCTMGNPLESTMDLTSVIKSTSYSMRVITQKNKKKSCGIYCI